MYNIDEIKELIKVLEESSLSTLELENENGSRIYLEKPSQGVPVTAPVATAPVAVPVATAEPAPVDNAKTINAPIVGVFYASSAPGKETYVSLGKRVSKGDTVCIIEAMKCMNEIQAEEDCEIIEVLVKDGELVEFGQPLFKIR